MGEFKTEADRDPEDLNRTAKGNRKRGKWGKRLGLTKPMERRAQLDEQDNIRANEPLKQYSLGIDFPKVAKESEGMVDASDRKEDLVQQSLETRKDNQVLPSVTQKDKK